MTPLVAAATSASPWPAALLLLGVALVFVAGYGLACWRFPFGHCRRCHGDGKRRSSSGKHFRLCRRCKGTGRRIRFGRWIYNHVVRMRREAD